MVAIRFGYTIQWVSALAGAKREAAQAPLRVPQKNGARRNIGHSGSADLITHPNNPAVDNCQLPIGRVENRSQRGLERQRNLSLW